ncbi:hypothetical protein C3B64_00965 [Clostridium botulinum]|uniref:YozE SAM-like domain-containing protein n=1 Tax=Clostridium botulinum TaxID=1491 RepID=A0AAU8YSS0_CLOBO|nr:sterile alpha motif-like domain-containing protein [Clostridium sporogenes]AVP62900.1 hypothetical protein C3B64_00965 [Clostridium botulinum]MCF4018381.1 sterile alpha motif-like domain-containing protein [Clostridium sporogenes]NFG01897.1 hypothetical protein [Clostridium sporogenes]
MYKNYEDLNHPSCYEKLKDNEKEALDKWIKAKFEVAGKAYNKRSSYGLKHDFKRDTGIYVYNGVFKGAMLNAGFKAVDETQLNWDFYIKERIPDGFYSFCIKRYKHNNSILGDFARDMDKDSKFPKESKNKEEIEEYLYIRNACKEAMKAFERAWNYYDKSIKKKK